MALREELGGFKDPQALPNYQSSSTSNGKNGKKRV
jgi:hypothetical protein